MNFLARSFLAQVDLNYNNSTQVELKFASLFVWITRIIIRLFFIPILFYYQIWVVFFSWYVCWNSSSVGMSPVWNQLYIVSKSFLFGNLIVTEGDDCKNGEIWCTLFLISSFIFQEIIKNLSQKAAHKRKVSKNTVG